MSRMTWAAPTTRMLCCASSRAPDGKAVRYLSDEPVGASAVKRALSGRDMGGTVLPDGHLEMVDLDGSQANDIREVLAQLHTMFHYTRGDAELREVGTHYERASTARAAATVREPLAATREAGGTPAGGRVDPDVHTQAVADTHYYRVQPRTDDPQDLLRPGRLSHMWTDATDDPRRGVSVMANLDDLHRYVVRRNATLAGNVVVTLRGRPSEDEARDAAVGEELIHPTEVVSVDDLDEERLRAAVEEANPFTDPAEAWREFVKESGYGQPPPELPPPPTPITELSDSELLAQFRHEVHISVDYERVRELSAEVMRRGLSERATQRGAALSEASFYTEILHPRDRLGRWMESQFGERQAKPGAKKGNRAQEYRPARWHDTGQDLPQMVTQAVSLLHPSIQAVPHATPVAAEHAEMVAAVLDNRPMAKGASKEAKKTVDALRKAAQPDLHERWLSKLHQLATGAHGEQTDKAGVPYMRHIEAVADSVSDDAKPVAIFRRRA